MAIDFKFIYLILPMLSVCRSKEQLMDVRLVDGPSINAGTVMYTKDCQTWETTCGINLGISDVIVICKHLGFAGGNRALHISPFQGNYGAPKTHTTCSGKSNYIGCFADMTTDRVLSGSSEPNFENLTIEKCLKFCGMTSQMVFAGVENSKECYCGDAWSDFRRHGQVSEAFCHVPCVGSNIESCGGSGYIAIFNVSANRSSTQSPVVSPCNINSTQPTTTTQRSTISSTGKTSTSNIPQSTSSEVSITKATMPPVAQASTPSSTTGVTNDIDADDRITISTVKDYTKEGLTFTSTNASPADDNLSFYAAVGGGVAGAVVLSIVIIAVVYICKRRGKDDQRHGLDLKDIPPAGTAPPVGYDNAIGYFPDPSGVDPLHIDMNDDQQEEVEKDAFTAQMKRGTMLVEYVNMKDRDNSGVLEPEASLHVRYENMRDDSSGKSVVTSKAEQDFNRLHAVSTKRRPEPDSEEQAMAAGSLYAIPEKNRKSQMSHQGPVQPPPDESADDAGILYGIPEKNRKSKLSQSVPVLPLSDNVDTMYAMPNKPRFGRVDGDTTEMVENELYG